MLKRPYLKTLGTKPQLVTQEHTHVTQWQVLFLAFLAQSDIGNKELLAQLFWPHLTTPVKKLNERLKELSNLAPSLITDDGGILRANYQTDIQFIYKSFDQENDEGILEFYTGQFLQGYRSLDNRSLKGKEDLQEWIQNEQDALAELVQQAHIRLAKRLAMQGQYKQAFSVAKKVTGITTDRVDVLPDVLQEAHRVLLTHSEAFAKRTEVKLRKLDTPVLATSKEKAREQLQCIHNIPRTLEPVIGRDEFIKSWMLELRHSKHRLFTIHGPAGIGKTRLAIAIGIRSCGYRIFQDGIYWVNAQQVRDAKTLLSAIASTLDLSMSTLNVATLCRNIASRAILLIVDNVDDLIQDSGIFESLLDACPQLRIVVTSRLVLHLGSECVWYLPSLTYPDVDKADVIIAYGAVQLFVQQVKHFRRDFELTSDNSSVVGGICRFVGGNPLALRQVAAWISIESLEVVYEKVSSLLLSQGLREAEHHADMELVFTMSLDQLPVIQAAQFECLAVFEGAFTSSAAQEILGLDLETLTDLKDRALIESLDETYSLHPLHKHFLKKTRAAKHQDYVEAHAAYYLKQLNLVINGDSEQKLRVGSELAAAFQNLGKAWRWLVGQRKIDRLVALSYPLMHLSGYYAKPEEGLQLMYEAHKVSKEYPRQQARLQAIIAFLNFRTGRYEQAIRLANDCLALLYHHEKYYSIALNAIGSASDLLGDFSKAAEAFKAITSIPGIDLGDYASALGNLGMSMRNKGDWEEAEACFRDAREVFVKQNKLTKLTWLDHEQGLLAYNLKLYNKAEKYFRRGLEDAASEKLVFIQPHLHFALADMHLALEKVGEAQKHLAAGFTFTTSRPTLHAKGLIIAAKRDLMQENFEQGIIRLEESISILRDAREYPRLRQAELLMVKLLMAKDDLTQAQALVTQLKRVHESMFFEDQEALEKY